MNAIIRHDYYPNGHSHRREAPARAIAGSMRFQAARGLAYSPNAPNAPNALNTSNPGPCWQASPVRTTPAPDAPPVDVVRVFAALFGLAVYVGVPAGALGYLALSLTR